MNAREAAKMLLAPLVRRGDSIEEICSWSRVTSFWGAAVVQIGGSVYYQGQTHKIGQKEIVVKVLDGMPCLHIFLVEDLCAEIRQEEQLPAARVLKDGSRQFLLWD